MKAIKRLLAMVCAVVLVAAGFGVGKLDVSAKTPKDFMREAKELFEKAVKESRGEIELLGASDGYRIMVGDVQVTSQNKDNIPGIKGGKASYNPTTHTLTLTNVTGFDKPVDMGGLTLGILSYEEDLHIVGNADFKDLGIGILQSYDLTMEGNFTFDVVKCGIMANDLTINNGKITVKTYDTVGEKNGIAIYGDDNLTIKEGVIYAYGEGYGIASDEGKVKIQGGTLDVTGLRTAVYSNGSTIEIPEYMQITSPVGGKLNKEKNTIVDASGKEAKTVKISRRAIAGEVGIYYVKDSGNSIAVKVSNCNVKKLNYQWKRDGKNITGATGSVYNATKADVGKTITCEVSDADGKYSGKLESKAGVEVTKDKAGKISVERNSKVELAFTDVKAGEWYVTAIQFAFDNGYMVGTSDTTFGTNGLLTRAQFITVLHNLEGKPDQKYKAYYTDVPNNQWYTTPIMWATKKEITKGVKDKLFGTDQKISREQLATLLYRYAEYKGYSTKYKDTEWKKLPDKGEVSTWAVDATKWAVSHGIMSGKLQSDKTKRLDPKGQATRAECAQMIWNFYNEFMK